MLTPLLELCINNVRQVNLPRSDASSWWSTGSSPAGHPIQGLFCRASPRFQSIFWPPDDTLDPRGDLLFSTFPWWSMCRLRRRSISCRQRFPGEVFWCAWWRRLWGGSGDFRPWILRRLPRARPLRDLRPLNRFWKNGIINILVSGFDVSFRKIFFNVNFKWFHHFSRTEFYVKHLLTPSFDVVSFGMRNDC